MIKTTTCFKWMAMLCLLLISGVALSQTVNGMAPSNVTQRSTVTLTGTGFTNTSTVRFYTGTDSSTAAAYVNATQVTYVSATQLKVVVPAVTAVGSAPATRAIRVYNGSTAGAAFSYTYTAPAATPAVAGVTRIITNYNGYWSTTATANSSVQPDTGHSLMAFQYNNTLYSTGPEQDVTNVLANANTGAYTTGNWRALPINNIDGTVPTGANNPNLIVLASRVDGDANNAVPTASTVNGLSVRDVLIDGFRGLNIGTGVTNLPSTSVLTFQATNISAGVATDEVPDIMVSQIADPSDNSFSVYCFLDSNGNIVGSPVQIALNSINPLGTYKTDFFTLQAGAPLNTATVNGWTTVGANTRQIRVAAYKLSDFGINETNRTQVASFKVMPSGTSDPAFMAYNRSSFQVPAPEISGQPQSVAKCPGTTATFTVTLTSTGTELTYHWEKNGNPISNGPSGTGSTYSGTDTATLTVTGITAQDNGVYRCVVSNPGGAAFSNSAYLNTVILSASGDVSTCINNPVAIQVNANGNSPVYQWYSNTVNSTTGGTLISGANTSTYTPPTNVAGTRFYYAEVYPSGYECAKTASTPVTYTVFGSSVAGTVSGNQSVCPGAPATVTLSGYTGTIQWQTTTTSGGTGGWANVAGATSASYTNPSVSQITYYRAVVTNGSCASVTSGVTTISPITSFTWTGAVSSNWHTPNNWSCNAVPTLNDDVTIPVTANQPVISQAITALAKTLTLQPNTSLTANSGTNIQVQGAVTVDPSATFTLQNNANLLQDPSATASNNNGKITITRNSNSLYKLDYTLWSSPVTGQNLFGFSPNTVNTRFYTYKPATDVYARVPNLSSTSTTTFDVAKGYLIRMPNAADTPGYNEETAALAFPGVFTGTPNNGTIYAAVAAEGQGYNAIGNPYPSAINVFNFIDTNAASLADGTLYFWRKRNNSSNPSYATITKFAYARNEATGGDAAGLAFPDGQQSAWTINTGQGFIVKVKPGTTQVAFTNAMRRNTNTNQIFRQAQPEGNPSKLTLTISAENGAYNATVLGYSSVTTNDFDFGYDGKAFADGALQLYTLQNTDKMVIQARAAFTDTDRVLTGFTTTQPGTYTISLTDKTGTFSTGQSVYLKDSVTGTVHNFADGNYSFATEAGTFNDRFEVLYNTTVLGTATPNGSANQVVVYKNSNGLQVSTTNAAIKTITLHDINGRVLYKKDNISQNQVTVNDLTTESQVILVNVITQDGAVTNKKVVY